MEPQTLESIVQRLEDLPTLPSVVYELSRVINDPMSSTSDVEAIMAKDQSLSATVLKLVNSAYYAIPGGVTSLSRAIAYLGFDTVNQLVLAASIIRALDAKSVKGHFDLPSFWKHAIGVAVVSETIAKHIHHPVPSDLFTCGLVHDMGKVAIYTIDPEMLMNVVAAAAEENLTFIEGEIKLGTPRHTFVGHALAQKWNLPLTVQNAIKYHHSPDLADRSSLTSDMNRDIDIVLLANLLTHALKFGNSGHNRIPGAPKEVLGRLAIDPEAGLKTLLQELKRALERAGDFIKFLSEG